MANTEDNMTQAVATTDYGREKLELIKQTVAKGASDLELELFLHACRRTGLDPLMKQIYAIKRWSAADRREVMSFQTGIDGYRLIADRTGCYAGSSDPIYTTHEDGSVEAAQVTVTKLVGGIPCQFSASARWQEYCQMNKEGQPTAMWKRMPFLMLGKCAEALALRKAFPAELSGVYTHEEMMQADSGKPMAQVVEAPAQAVAGEHGPATAAPAGGGSDVPASPDASLDWQAALDADTSLEDLQRTWDGIVKDGTIAGPARAGLYKYYQARAKAIKAA